MKERTEAGAASPAVVFVLLLALLGAVVGGVIWAGQIDGQPIPPAPVTTPEPTEDQTLTNAEAIARFKELDRQRLAAFAGPNLDLLEEVFVEGAPAMRRATKAIAELEKRNLSLEHVRYDVRRLSILAKGLERITIQQEVILRTALSDEAGTIERRDRPKFQRIKWELRRTENHDWRIFDGAVRTARFLDS